MKKFLKKSGTYNPKKKKKKKKKKKHTHTAKWYSNKNFKIKLRSIFSVFSGKHKYLYWQLDFPFWFKTWIPAFKRKPKTSKDNYKPIIILLEICTTKFSFSLMKSWNYNTNINNNNNNNNNKNTSKMKSYLNISVIV